MRTGRLDAGRTGRQSLPAPFLACTGASRDTAGMKRQGCLPRDAAYKAVFSNQAHCLHGAPCFPPSCFAPERGRNLPPSGGRGCQASMTPFVNLFPGYHHLPLVFPMPEGNEKSPEPSGIPGCYGSFRFSRGYGFHGRTLSKIACSAE